MTESNGFTLTRTFDAPREAVFDAWITPAHFSRWFGGAQSEVPIETLSMDVRPGGAWSATMFAGPDRYEIAWKGTFLEVDPPSRLVLTMTDGPEPEENENITVELVDLGGRTEMIMTQTGGHLTEEQYEQTKVGWNTFFDVLGEIVEG